MTIRPQDTPSLTFTEGLGEQCEGWTDIIAALGRDVRSSPATTSITRQDVWRRHIPNREDPPNSRPGPVQHADQVAASRDLSLFVRRTTQGAGTFQSVHITN